MLEILKANFKELLTTFIKKPWVGLVLLFIWSTGFFMREWVASKDNCQEQINKERLRADSATAIAFTNLLLLQQERAKLELERKKNDSLFRVKLEEQIKELKLNDQRR